MLSFPSLRRVIGCAQDLKLATRMKMVLCFVHEVRHGLQVIMERTRRELQAEWDEAQAAAAAAAAQDTKKRGRPSKGSEFSFPSTVSEFLSMAVRVSVLYSIYYMGGKSLGTSSCRARPPPPPPDHAL
jgi:hypothetical protein